MNATIVKEKTEMASQIKMRKGRISCGAAHATC